MLAAGFVRRIAVEMKPRPPAVVPAVFVVDRLNPRCLVRPAIPTQWPCALMPLNSALTC